MRQDIQRHIELINQALVWAKKFGRDTFPKEEFKEYRRKLRRIDGALSENCSAAAYGESQVGKSYLMSSLLSSPSIPFRIQNKGKTYSFIDELNPSGGKNTKIESTGVITRFTLSREDHPMKDYIQVHNLSIVDLILMITDAYYNDIKINTDSALGADQINKELDNIRHLGEHSDNVVQSYIGEDDIYDIFDYIKDVIGNPAISVIHSDFLKVVAPIIQYIPSTKWIDVFCLLWNRNEEISRLFSRLLNAYQKLSFRTEVYVPFDAVLSSKGTLLKIDWLDIILGKDIKLEEGEQAYTDVYSPDGQILVKDFSKGELSALIAELTFQVAPELAEERSFLRHLDLLDFPGARSREMYEEGMLKEDVLPNVLRRGKVAYLFNKYSRSLRISSLLFCHHNDQKSGPGPGDTLDRWIRQMIGESPEKRASMLQKTGGIAPLFFVATKFNIDLERNKTDRPDESNKLVSHWARFNTVIPEIIKPHTWLERWVKTGGIFTTEAFQNIYPLRDFYWSGKNNLFVGYKDGLETSEETEVYQHPDYPDYFDRLRESFLEHPFIQKHFASPEQTWEEVATINNDGSKAIIRNLDKIAGVLDDARRQKYLEELEDIKQRMYDKLGLYFVPEDDEAKNIKIGKIAGDITYSLILKVGERVDLFGRIIDLLMVPSGPLRSIAYEVLNGYSEIPLVESHIELIRKLADIDIRDSRDVNIQKLCTYFNISSQDELEDKLRQDGSSIDEIISKELVTYTTKPQIITREILQYWVNFLNKQVTVLSSLVDHADELVFMLTALLGKTTLEQEMLGRIERYEINFNSSELPNVIADYASLALNNFVSTVGRTYIPDSELAQIQARADKCNLPKLDLSPVTLEVVRQPKDLMTTLRAFDLANKSTSPKATMLELPFWSNFEQWKNLIVVGLLYASDISSVDPIANGQIKVIMEQCESLYTK